MRPALRLSLLAAFFTVGALPPDAAGAEPDLHGMYASEGLNPDGSTYRGIVVVVRHGETFLLAWMFPKVEGDSVSLVPKSAGIGIVSGGTLAVSFYGGEVAGVVVYQIESRGERLTGRWAVAGSAGAVYEETLTKLPRAAVTPETGTSLPPAPKKMAPARRTVVTISHPPAFDR